MLKVEKQKGAKYIILNIWDDDHYRSLDAWRSIRFGQGSDCGFTLPHLRVDVKNNRCEQMENLLKTREDVFKLRDKDFLWAAFENDPILQLVMAGRGASKGSMELNNPVPVSFGIPEETITNTEIALQIKKIHTEAALFASKNIVSWTENFIKESGKKFMIILSFRKDNIARELHNKPRFDQSFVDWLKNKPYPVIDMRDIFREEYKRFKVDIDSFLTPFYNGHHTPAGNFFMAWRLKDKLVEWLDPAPKPYQ
ncbi:MAG: hypothetical protein JRH15_03330 [Deltaproteobacteria bacterium]|nr:hypothetical protein [Deltaproteobacteria bacterium]